MSDIIVRRKNDFMVHVECDQGIARELSEHFTIDVPGAKFMPAFRARKWDGKLRIFNYQTNLIYAGLTEKIEEFAKSNEYTFKNTLVSKGKAVTLDDVNKFVESLDFHAHGKKISLRDYQVAAAHRCISEDRALILSPTSSGKSAQIGTVVRWHVNHGRKCLIIVPTIALVTQMYGDLEDYFSASGWSVEENCYKIMGGIEKKTDHPIIISTWQSIYKMPESFFSEIDCIVCDEAHLAKGKSITDMMGKMPEAPFRYGFTGTLDGTQCNALVLEGLFGRVYKAITTKELIQNDQISDIKIKCLLLQYSDEEKKKVSKDTYQDEIDFLVTHEKRNKFITNLVVSQTGNTLVLFNLVEKHGKPLYELINSKVHQGRKVFLVYGGVDADEREQIRQIIETESDAIVVASYGVFSTGISIRNLHNVVFASPSKSRIRNLQSIGRGLRKGDNKSHCNLYDIGDDLSWKSKKNHTLKHAVERIKIYASEGFNYKMIKVNL